MASAVNKASYWTKKLVGDGKDSCRPIQRSDDLESSVGDETLDGKEQKLKYFTDRLRIDKVRGMRISSIA
uniref:hypothetical protein n=1 Tax=unclassified Variovorax TaxID=663243 RepID=UPI000D36BB58